MCCYGDKDDDNDGDEEKEEEGKEEKEKEGKEGEEGEKEMIVHGHLFSPTHRLRRCYTSCCELTLYKKNSFIALFLYSGFHCTSNQEKHPISLTGLGDPLQLDSCLFLKPQ